MSKIGVVICAPPRDREEWGMIIRVLKEEYRVDTIYTVSTTEAFDRVCEHHPRVLVSDLVVPGGRAFDLLNEVRQRFDRQVALALAIRRDQFGSRGMAADLNPLDLRDPFRNYVGTAELLAQVVRHGLP